MEEKIQKKKKRKKKQEQFQLLLFLLLGLAIIAVLVLLIGAKLFPKDDYYRVRERASRVAGSSVEYDGKQYDAVGWIQVQGTNIDFPVIFKEGEFSYPAQVDRYAWLSNLSTDFQRHIEISGHNIFNLSNHPELESEIFTRFEELMSFSYYDFAKENKYIQLTLGDKEYVYKIFAVGFVPTAETILFPNSAEYSKDDVADYLEKFKKYNLYHYDIDVNKNDSIISLVTCTRFYDLDEQHEFRVLGRLVREGEKLDNYSVKKDSKYQAVEEILKGDDEDEI